MLSNQLPISRHSREGGNPVPLVQTLGYDEAELAVQVWIPTFAGMTSHNTAVVSAMDKILQATPLSDYRLDIVTSSGVAGIFDVKPYMGRGVFKELADQTYFAQVKPIRYGVAWPHAQDLSSDTIIHDIKMNNSMTNYNHV